jgi:general secretion pathway protein G
LEQPSHERTVAAKLQVNALRCAIDRYRADVGDYPSESVGLRALTHNVGARSWHGPYLHADIPLDPWGKAYIYHLNPTGRPEVISFGADGKPGGSGLNSDVSSVDATGTDAVKPPSWKGTLRFVVFLLSALGFFGYPFLPALLTRLNAGFTR